jgi:hypothetical protein
VKIILALRPTPGHVRLSIGIEHIDDILADLVQALAKVRDFSPQVHRRSLHPVPYCRGQPDQRKRSHRMSVVDQTPLCSLDHPVGAREQYRRNIKPECLCRPEN